MAHDPLSHVLDSPLAGGGGATHYQVLAVGAALLVGALYIPLARKIKDGTPPRGALWNFLEMLLVFIRDEVARPNIGEGHHHHDDHHELPGHGSHHGPDQHDEKPAVKHHSPHRTADRYVPFLWTLFLFILFCNLLGMVPFMGAPTADIGVTVALAGIVFVVIHVSSLLRNGPVGYVRSFIPSLKSDSLVMNIFLAVIITPLIAAIEVMGALIRAAVLAIRLFANIFAGHVALAVILAFAITAENSLNVTGGIAALLLGTALSVLELFVAFLQAFVFTLLTAIFLGMQLNPEH